MGVKKEKIKITAGKILGLDYGTKRIGLAISDGGQNQAFIYDTLAVDDFTFQKLKDICRQELIDKIVVGLPLSLSGAYTDKTEEVISFIEELETYLNIPVETEDERLTSVEAGKRKNWGGIDENAAQIILQQYLDQNHNH